MAAGLPAACLGGRCQYRFLGQCPFHIVRSPLLFGKKGPVWVENLVKCRFSTFSAACRRDKSVILWYCNSPLPFSGSLLAGGIQDGWKREEERKEERRERRGTRSFRIGLGFLYGNKEKREVEAVMQLVEHVRLPVWEQGGERGARKGKRRRKVLSHTRRRG